MRFRLLILTIAVLGALLIPGALTAQAPADDAPAPRWIELYWDVGTTVAADFVETHLEPAGITTQVIAQWRNNEQRWVTWRPGVPAFVNRFTDLEPGAIYWFFVVSAAPDLTITPAVVTQEQPPASDAIGVRTFEGSGNRSFSIDLAGGAVIFDYTHDGHGRFDLEIGGASIGSGRGSLTDFSVNHASGEGIRTVRVTATGAWVFHTRQFLSAQPSVPLGEAFRCRSVAGYLDVEWEETDSVRDLPSHARAFLCEESALTPPFDLRVGSGAFAFTHEGSGSFSIRLVREDGSQALISRWTDGVGVAEQAAGNFQVSPGGGYRLLVEASGPWYIVFGQ